MRGLLITLLLVVLLAGTAYFLYQVPRIQALFQTSTPKENPLAFLEDLPEVETPEPVEEKSPEPQSSRPPATAPSAEPAEVPVSNQVPNAELSRTLIQILKAKGLASGISLEVSDRIIRVHGKVASQEAREELLYVLENARESRTVDLSTLTVESSETDGATP